MSYHLRKSELMLDEGFQKESGAALDAALKAVKNAPTLGGAGAGAVIGGVKGGQGAGEGQTGAGVLGGAVTGAVAGGFLGGGLRNIYKNAPAGYKKWKKGQKQLSKELKKKGIKGEDAKFWTAKNLKSYLPGTKKSKRYKFVKKKGEKYKRLSEHYGTGKRGQKLLKAEDKALKQTGAYGKVLSGRRQMIGGVIGGGIAAGYGGYQLKSTGGIAKKTDQEKNLDQLESRVDNAAAAKRAAGRYQQ